LTAVQDSKTNLWGFLNQKGKVIIPFQYQSATKFSEGLSAVSNQKLKRGAFIDKTGKVIIKGKFKFNISEPFINGVSTVMTYSGSSFTFAPSDPKYRYIDKDGEFLIKESFKISYTFNKNGFAIVGKEKFFLGNYSYWIIDKKGNKTHKGTFSKKPKFINGKAVTYIKRKRVTIDETGKIIE